jgi:hypothetical protein
VEPRGTPSTAPAAGKVPADSRVADIFRRGPCGCAPVLTNTLAKQSHPAHTHRAGTGHPRHRCMKSRLWCSMYANPIQPARFPLSTYTFLIDDINPRIGLRTIRMCSMPRPEKTGFTQIGGVVCRSPLIAIAAYEREHSIPNEYINCSMSVLPGQPSCRYSNVFHSRAGGLLAMIGG